MWLSNRVSRPWSPSMLVPGSCSGCRYYTTVGKRWSRYGSVLGGSVDSYLLGPGQIAVEGRRCRPRPISKEGEPEGTSTSLCTLCLPLPRMTYKPTTTPHLSRSDSYSSMMSSNNHSGKRLTSKARRHDRDGERPRHQDRIGQTGAVERGRLDSC